MVFELSVVVPCTQARQGIPKPKLRAFFQEKIATLEQAKKVIGGDVSHSLTEELFVIVGLPSYRKMSVRFPSGTSVAPFVLPVYICIVYSSSRV